MGRLPLALTAATALSGCWWNTGIPQQDTGWYNTESSADPGYLERSDFYSPNWWTLEIWGLYDGERLTDFRYHASSSGAVPPFVILRFNDPQWHGEEECYWAGQVKIQGWTVLTEDQYVAWGFTTEQVDTNCADFDRAVWFDDSPQTVIESLYWTLGYGPPTETLAAELGRDSDGPMSWADDHDDRAFTMHLGFERDLGVWEHFEAGAAYALATNVDIVEWDHWGRPYPQDLGPDIARHVIASGTLAPQKLSLLGIQ